MATTTIDENSNKNKHREFNYKYISKMFCFRGEKTISKNAIYEYIYHVQFFILNLLN